MWRCPTARSATRWRLQGKLDEALKAYRDALAIRERLAAADRSNTDAQRDLAVSYEQDRQRADGLGKLDEALEAYRADLAIAERLAAADASNTKWQRDLAVTHNKVGDVLKAQGKLDEALNAYRESLAIIARLVAADSEQHRMAARPLDQPPPRRRRAGSGRTRG